MATEVPIKTGLLITPVPTNADATGNYCIPASGRGLLIEAINTSGAPVTVTLDDVASVQPEGSQAWNPDVQQSVPATTGRRVFRVKDLSRFRDPVTGRVSWSQSAAAGVSYNVYEL